MFFKASGVGKIGALVPEAKCWSRLVLVLLSPLELWNFTRNRVRVCVRHRFPARTGIHARVMQRPQPLRQLLRRLEGFDLDTSHTMMMEMVV